MSLRLDNIVAELGNCSRAKANELLKNQKVLVNHEIETKSTKQIKPTDQITIHGKGKFEVAAILGNNKKGRYILLIQKYV